VKKRETTPLTDAQREALGARFALRLTARLDDAAQGLPHDITERLRVARQQAVDSARAGRLSAAVAPSAPGRTGQVVGLQWAGGHGALVGDASGAWNEAEQSRQPSHGRRLDDGPVAWGWRLASALPVLALLAGFWAINVYQAEEKVQAAAEIDTALLTDDLPPDAYSDPGFSEFLRGDARTSVRPIDITVPEPDGDLKTSDTAPAGSTP
jgi:hypothetical protein